MTALIRQPAVAGSFYPAEPSALQSLIQELFATTTLSTNEHQSGDPASRSIKAIIAPHAGYVYSGPIAANAYQCLREDHHRYDRVLLLGPSHQVALDGLALSSAASYLTPLGPIPIDVDSVQAIGEFDFVSVNDEAHRDEHSIEVHLPFLQSALDDFSLIPIVVGDTDPEHVAQILDLFIEDERTLIVISTDLSHFHDYATAKHKDQLTSNAILNYQYNDIEYRDACGRNPVKGVLYWAKQHHFKIKLIDLRNSGDTSGDKNRVVGYAAYHIYTSC